MTGRSGEHGDEWLGGLPPGWTVQRLGHLGDLVKGRGGSKADNRESGVPVVRYGDLYTKFDTSISWAPAFVGAEDAANYATLPKGSLLFAASGESPEEIGKSAVALLDGPAVTGGDTVVFHPSDQVDPLFLAYALESAPLRANKALRGTGFTVVHISASKLKTLPIPLPPKGQQRAIADYLQRETARIDTLIEEQQRLIEMLLERRKAVIASTVARGLDRSVEVKASGLPGADVVPGHWGIRPLRYTFSYQEGPGIMAADFREDGVPLLRVASVRTPVSTLEGCNYLDPEDVERRWSHFQVDVGDLLISASASMGTVSEVTTETVGAVPYTGIIRIKPGRMVKEFIRWFVVSDEFIDQVDSLKTGSTIQHFGPTHLARMHVALPPAGEQRQIAAYLDEQTSRIDGLIAETERFIELSRERRAALITAAVTGHIDVPEVA